MRLQDPAMVKREILFLKRNYWILRDTVASSQEHRVDVRFHFDSLPGAETSLNICCFANGHQVEEEAFVSHCYGQKEAAKALSFSATLKDGAELSAFCCLKNRELSGQ